MQQKGYLEDVALIRPILVVLLVFYHAFAPYSGVWPPIVGYPDVPVYWWLGRISFAFMLEMFVFISGNVFGFQVRTKGEEKLKAKDLLLGKFKRLIIPCVVFSLFYIILFRDITQPITKTIYSVVNGVGHMWFLLMLFWCFVGLWILEKLHINRNCCIIALMLCSLIPSGELPLQLSKVMYYMFFFYAGYSLQRTNVQLTALESTSSLIALMVSFVILFPVLTMLKENVSFLMGRGNQTITPIFVGVVKRLCQLLISSVGILMMLSLVRNVLRKHASPLADWVIKVGELCMGVYLLQQFILNGLYYYTELPTVFGPYWLPWVGFIVTFISSVLIAMIMRKTKIGLFLIG